jgi:tyrosine-protein phosphatase MSG5
LDYERALKGGDSPGKSSVGGSEDEEWGRRRQEVDSPDEESQEILKEAKELDRAMEERRERKLSLASNSSTASFTGAVGNGAPWRVRYGAGIPSRSRAASIESNFTSITSVSAFSDDPSILEEDEDDHDQTKATTPDTDATDDDAHCFGLQQPPHTATLGGSKARVPPSAPPTKTSFGLPPPSAPAYQQTFIMSSSHVSNIRNFTQLRSDASQRVPPNVQTPPFKKEKRRPPPLKDVTPVVPFPSVQVQPEVMDNDVSSHHSSISASSGMISSASSSRSRRLSARLSSFVPFPIRTALSGVSASEASQPTATTLPTPTATQTLFVFPPSPRARGASTPSTLTLVCTPLLTPNFSGIGNQTPRAGVFRKRTDSRKSWIGLSAVTPTTATARVDARGLFESK